jgi:hypothetical protein
VENTSETFCMGVISLLAILVHHSTDRLGNLFQHRVSHTLTQQRHQAVLRLQDVTKGGIPGSWFRSSALHGNEGNVRCSATVAPSATTWSTNNASIPASLIAPGASRVRQSLLLNQIHRIPNGSQPTQLTELSSWWASAPGGKLFSPIIWSPSLQLVLELGRRGGSEWHDDPASWVHDLEPS